MTGGIFVSYRRSDSAAWAGWLADRLSQQFGRERVFFDRERESLPAGERFGPEIERRVREADVVLAVIGSDWLVADERSGRPRVLDSEDFVRRELATALADDTLVVLWSDHGYHLGEHLGTWQKRTLFEESARAPLIIYQPGAAGNGQASQQIVEFTDIYPTVAELCGLPLPDGLTGRSLVPLLETPNLSSWKGAAYTQVLRPADDRLPTPVMGRSIRTDRWRYTEWAEGKDGIELYDHENDPREFTNLADDPEFQPVIDALRPKLDAKIDGTIPKTPFNQPRL